MPKKISLVIPVFNEEENILHLYQALDETIKKLPDFSFEIIFVDDGSKDHTREIIHEIETKDERIQSIFLAKNYGHQLALTCGMDFADGDAVITMDGDMQHPPELIPTLIQAWQDGFEIVQTVRQETEGVSFLKRWTSKMYYKFFNFFSDVPIQAGGSDFRLMDKVCVQALKRYREHSRFLRGLVSNLGFKKTHISFIAPKRYAGTPKYSVKKMFVFACDGIFSFSTLPLHFGLYLGLFMAFVSFLLCCYLLFEKYVQGDVIEGWTVTSICILIFSSVQMILLGVIGEYVGHIFTEAKNRPLYLIARGQPKTFQETKKS